MPCDGRTRTNRRYRWNRTEQGFVHVYSLGIVRPTSVRTIPRHTHLYDHTLVTKRMAIALASLVSGVVALYLHLWKLGLVGSLACDGSGGCEFVQGSRYGWFMGVDVALIGAVGYAILFAAAMMSTSPTYEDEKWANTMLQLIIWPAVLFTVRLKYAEFVILKSFCPWCAISATIITLCAILAIMDRRRLNRLGIAPI